ncbi:MAG: carboxypeptidase-like regulatory domain-containing protein [Candidatus Kapaibacterium sp.]
MIARALSILILFIAASLAVRAQTTGSLSGCITDTSGRPLVGATVIVVGTTPLRGAVVKPDGSYKIVGVKSGEYQIRVRALGYRASYKPATIEVGIESRLDVQAEKMSETEWRAEYRAVFGCFAPPGYITIGRPGTEHHITRFDLDPSWEPDRIRYRR